MLTFKQCVIYLRVIIYLSLKLYSVIIRSAQYPIINKIEPYIIVDKNTTHSGTRSFMLVCASNLQPIDYSIKKPLNT